MNREANGSDVHEGRFLRGSDAELVQRARNADEAAFAELVRRYERRVLALVYRLLGDRAESADVTQETFMRAYESLGRFDERRPLMPWLATIARNLARNVLSSSWARRQSLDEQTSSAGGEFERVELADEVQRVLANLSTEQREVIVLRHVAGLSYQEIAEATHEKVSTVKSRLFEARRRVEAVRAGEED